MKVFKISFFSLLALGLLFSTGCDNDDPASPVSVLSILANGTDLQSGDQVEKDLNGATSAIDVPLDAVITITFAKAVDAATVSGSTVKLAQDGSDVAATVSASGAVVTMKPDQELERGLDYTLSLSAGIAAEDGGQFTETTRTFTAAGRAEVTPPQSGSQLAYWKLDGNINSTNGSYNGQAIEVNYMEDRFGNQSSAGLFDGDVSIAEIPNADQLMKSSMTISYWMYVDSVGHVGGHFVMGIGDVYGFFVEVQGGLEGMKLTGRYTKDDGTTTANDFFFNGDGKTGANGGWEAVEFEEDLSSTGGLGGLIDRKWAHVVWIYDAAVNKRHLYINGNLMETDNLNIPAGLANVTGLTFDDSDAGADVIGTSLALGFNHDRATTHWANEPWGGYTFPDANHFKGALDDIRIFEAALSASEVQSLYNDEK